MNYAIRHGEVMLVPLKKLPKGRTTKQTKFIVGHSETGHHHVLESKIGFDIQELDKAMLYIRLFEPANLVHNKSVNAHKTLRVPAGVYKIVHKSEYNPWTKLKQRVFD